MVGGAPGGFVEQRARAVQSSLVLNDSSQKIGPARFAFILPAKFLVQGCRRGQVVVRVKEKRKFAQRRNGGWIRVNRFRPRRVLGAHGGGTGLHFDVRQ